MNEAQQKMNQNEKQHLLKILDKQKSTLKLKFKNKIFAKTPALKIKPKQFLPYSIHFSNKKDEFKKSKPSY